MTCDTVGYFANNVDDLNLLSRVFRIDLDRRGGDKDETPFRVRDARIAMVKTHVWELARPATRAAWQRARELLVGAGAQIEDVDLPGGFARAHAWREVIAGSEARSAFLSRMSSSPHSRPLPGAPSTNSLSSCPELNPPPDPTKLE